MMNILLWKINFSKKPFTPSERYSGRYGAVLFHKKIICDFKKLLKVTGRVILVDFRKTFSIFNLSYIWIKIDIEIEIEILFLVT
jgi:hypothetical protein